MSVNVDGQALVKSVVTMLPVINLSVTNMRALHFLLCFVAEQSKNNKLLTPSIKCDKPLYVKACEIVMTNKTEIFVRLGGFLGYIGSLLERSGLRGALETVYAPVTAGHMITRKVYTRAVRCHMISASPVSSLMLGGF